MKQLRIYTLKDNASAKDYLENHWDKHLVSLPKFGITVEKVFMEDKDTDGPCHVYAIVSGEDLHQKNKDYMQSQAFKDDMIGFPMEAIQNVENVDLITYK